MTSIGDLSSVFIQRGPPPGDPASLGALVERITWGATPDDRRQALQLGHVGLVEQQLDHLAIPDTALDAALAPYTTLDQSAQVLLDLYSDDASPVPVHHLQQSVALRAVLSRRQLFERTVAVLNDHFSVYLKDGAVRLLKLVDDKHVMRAHAFGSFPALLAATVHSPAMLHYLDNHLNVAGGPQENYARELMELHTLGVDGGYSEDDVKEAARCLTGWSYIQLGMAGTFGSFRYLAANHDDGEKTVLGQVFPAGQGKADGDQLVALLAGHPNTAAFVARKLCTDFLVDDPPQAVIDAVAAAYMSSGGDLKAMLRVTLSLESFATAKPWTRRKFKQPLRWVTGLLRALGATPLSPPDWDEPGPFLEELRLLGQVPFDWFSPNGWPDGAGAWGRSLLPRWSFASRLAAGELTAAVDYDPESLPERLQATGQPSWGAALDVLLTGGGGLSPADRAQLDAHAAALPVIDTASVGELLALAASAPSYQTF